MSNMVWRWWLQASLLLLRWFFWGWWTGWFKWWLPEIVFMDGFLWKKATDGKWGLTKMMADRAAAAGTACAAAAQDATEAGNNTILTAEGEYKIKTHGLQNYSWYCWYSQRQPLSPWWSESLCISLHSKLFGHLRAIFLLYGRVMPIEVFGGATTRKPGGVSYYQRCLISGLILACFFQTSAILLW